MSAGESARKFYESARFELVAHIKLRESILLFYLGIMATLLGVAFSNQNINEILLVIPFIALSVSILVSQHHSAIGSLGLYCVEEIGPYIEKLQPPEFAPQWDNSKALLNAANEAMLSRMWAHIIVIMIPTILALALNYNHALNSAFPFGPL